MKQKITVIISLLIILTLSACGHAAPEKAESSEKLAIYEIGAGIDGCDGGKDPGIHNNIYKEWDEGKWGFFKSDDAPKNVTIEFEGKSYTGEYLHSGIPGFVTYQADYYDCEEDNMLFTVNSSNGAILEVDIFNYNDGNVTEEYCKKKALSLAEKYIDVDSYKLTAESSENGEYFFNFIKYIGPYETVSCLTLGYSADGELTCFYSYMTSEFEKALAQKDAEKLENDAAQFASEDAKQTVIKQIQSIYPTLDSYEIEDCYIVLLDNGNIGMIYQIGVEWINYIDTESGEKSYGSTISYILVTNE